MIYAGENMINKKPIKILSGVALGTQILATLILILSILNESAVYRLVQGNNQAAQGLFEIPWASVFVIPWPSVITILSYLGFAIILTVLAAKLEGKALRMLGIILAACLLAHGLTGTVQTLAANVIMARKGVYYLSAYSALSTFIEMIAGPLKAIGAACMYFTCGMCAFNKNQDVQKMY